MRPIDADALLEQMKHRKEYIGRPSDPVCLVEDAPTVDAVPIEKVAYLLAEYFDSPCNFSPLDEEMSEVCGENCDMDDVKCWERWIKEKVSK